MKIVIENSANIKFAGLIEATKHCEFDLHIWDTNQPFFDMVNLQSPDIIIGTNFKPTYRSDNYQLISLGQTQFADLHYEIPEVVDIASFGLGKNRTEMFSDVLYISIHTIDETFFDLLLDISQKFTLKIVGPTNLNTPEYLGNASTKELNDFMASANSVICYNNLLALESHLNGAEVFCTKPNKWDFPTVDKLFDLAGPKYPNLDIDVWSNTYHNVLVDLLARAGYDYLDQILKKLDEKKGEYNESRNNIQ